ncbi:hypothetical protein LR48_Vigan10g082500 [Vigna angularis]|uniref:Uncharacterized protein n=1 Tax=Phaseolus angularis TaxID=3914 RepID=A0A0L9VIW5_PHAAN|nr:hypothetical protein LR48_Vigan10g082500 [Vigna angularis]
MVIGVELGSDRWHPGSRLAAAELKRRLTEERESFSLTREEKKEKGGLDAMVGDASYGEQQCWRRLGPRLATTDRVEAEANADSGFLWLPFGFKWRMQIPIGLVGEAKNPNGFRIGRMQLIVFVFSRIPIPLLPLTKSLILFL